MNNLDELDEPNGLSAQDQLEQFKQALDHLNMQFLDKVTNIVKFIKNLEAERDVLACEAKRLTERKRSFDNRIEWLKNYVRSSMEVTNTDKIKSALFTIYVAQSQPSVEVTSIHDVDQEFLKMKVEVDKLKILDQVKSTGIIPKGVDIVQGTHLVIR